MSHKPAMTSLGLFPSPAEDSLHHQHGHQPSFSDVGKPLGSPIFIGRKPSHRLTSSGDSAISTFSTVGSIRTVTDIPDPTEDTTIRKVDPAHELVRKAYDENSPKKKANGEDTVAGARVDKEEDAQSEATVAGGLEYWGDIEPAEVDRYGFFPQQNVRQFPAHSIKAARDGHRSSTQRSKLMATLTSSPVSEKSYFDTPENQSERALIAKEVERSGKWTKMSVAENRRGNTVYTFEFSKKLVHRTFKGVPDCWRSSAWRYLLDKISAGRPFIRRGPSDTELLDHYARFSNCESVHDSQIDLDVPRTISGHVLFRTRHSGGQRLLFRVLHAISLMFPEVGYVQGMASIASTLLCYYAEEDTFIMMCRLWQERGMAKLFEQDFSSLMSAFKELEVRLKETKIEIGVLPTSFATRWYLTFFHVSVPFRTQLRIWDIIMLCGDESPHILHSVALALIEGMSDLLIDADFEFAMNLLTSPLPIQDDDQLLAALQKQLKPYLNR